MDHYGYSLMKALNEIYPSMELHAKFGVKSSIVFVLYIII